MAVDLVLLERVLDGVVAELEGPLAALDALKAEHPVEVTFYRAAVQVALVRWHAGHALRYVEEMKTNAVVAQLERAPSANAMEDAGSTPADDLASRFVVVPGS